MSKKRSTNRENLLIQKKNITEKIILLEKTLKGIEKSLLKLDLEEASSEILQSEETE